MSDYQRQIDVLKQHGVKVNEKDVLWCIHLLKAGMDQLVANLESPDAKVHKTELLFLEKGNEKAGLKHIWLQHKPSFEKLCDVHDEDSASKYIKFYMDMGHYATYGYKKDEKRGGLKAVYHICPGKFLVVVFGSNGYIITAYPVNEDTF